MRLQAWLWLFVLMIGWDWSLPEMALAKKQKAESSSSSCAQEALSSTLSEDCPELPLGEIDSLPAETDSSKKTSLKKDKKADTFKWKGNLKFSLRYLRNRAEVSEHATGFELTALNLRLDYKLQKKVHLKAHYQIDPIESQLKSAYVEIKDDTAWIDLLSMGFQPRFFEIQSELETDSLNHLAFFRMHDLSIQARSSFFEHWFLQGSLANGSLLDTRDISPRRVAKQDIILSDEFDETQASGGKNTTEVALGAGYRSRRLDSEKAFWRPHQLEVLAFSSVGAIYSDSPGFEELNEAPEYTGVDQGGTSYANTKQGINATLLFHQWHLHSQWIQANVRRLERQLLSLEGGLIWRSWTFLFGYSQQHLNIDPSPQSPVTWERQRYTPGVRYAWMECCDILLEATFNQEETGAKSINNDEALLTWVYQF